MSAGGGKQRSNAHQRCAHACTVSIQTVRMAAALLKPTTMMPLPRPVSASAVLPSSSPAAPGTWIPNSDVCCTVAGGRSVREWRNFRAAGPSCGARVLGAEARRRPRTTNLHHVWGLRATWPGAACERRWRPGPARARHAPGARTCAAWRRRRPASLEAKQRLRCGAACAARPATRAGAAQSASRYEAAVPVARWPRASPSRAAPAAAGAVRRQNLPTCRQAAAPRPRRHAPAP